MSRRGFGMLLPWGSLAALTACGVAASPAGTAPMSGAADASLPLVDPADPSAKALACTADASPVVTASNPKYQSGQACRNCALYAGQSGDAAGPCPLYPGKQVSASAWCNAYAKKTG